MEKESKLTEALLALISELARELQPGRRVLVSLDSSLGRELGLDSLSRMELLSRLEREFGTRLPDRLLVEAETPRDLLDALLQGGEARLPVHPVIWSRPPEVAIPERASTLLEVLDWHVSTHPDRPHIRLVDEDNREISYRQLFEGATKVSNGLRARGLQAGQTVALMLPTGKDFFEAFIGSMMAGGIPVPLYPPFRPSDLRDHLLRQAGILDNAQATRLLTTKEAQRIAPILQPLVTSLAETITVQQLAPSPSSGRLVVQAEDIALLQYTSGSTGQPKGVVLTQSNLLANLRALGQAAEVKSTDVFVSWMPLYHDMGLVGAWLASLYYGTLAVLMSPLSFLARPARWLWAIRDHQGTLTGAPNFAFELCAREIQDRDLEGLDLSTLRLAVCGAEPINPATVERFQQRFAPYGFRPEAFTPAYGLAEATVGLTLTPPGRGPRIERIERAAFSEGKAEPAGAGDSSAIRIVSCGKPLPDCRIRIADQAGNELPDRTVGRLEFQGPSCTNGYYRNPGATLRLFDRSSDGPWLDSGDLAFRLEGEIYLTGRSKDLIIRGGQHLFPEELEGKISELPNVVPGGVAVFGVPDPTLGTERLVVYAETTEREERSLDQLKARINSLSQELLGTPADEVRFGPPHSAPKTASGKIRRSATRSLFQQGRLGVRLPVWQQRFSLVLESAGPRIRRYGQQVSELCYASYAWVLFGLATPLIWLSIMVLPTLSLRRKLLRGGARFLLRMLGLPVEIEGKLETDHPCVMVSNHQSFVDSLLLAAVLPPDVAFTPGREFTRHWLPRLFLDRIGVQFVERLDPQGGVRDAEQLSEEAKKRSLMLFPEGAIFPAPGLRPFRMGAFVAAAQAGVPVLPMGILGTRSILPPKSWFPRWGRILLRIGEPIIPSGTDWTAAAKLHEESFTAILRLSGERAVV